MEMKFYKDKDKLNDGDLSDEDRIIGLELKVNRLSHFLKLMSRGYIILFIAITVTFIVTEHNIHKTDKEAEHTKTVQIAGGPVAVCLLDALRNVSPLLDKIPTVQMPLESYVNLQSHRYPGIECPEPIK